MRDHKYRGMSKNGWVYGLLHFDYGQGEYMITHSNGWQPSYSNPDEGESTEFTVIDENTIGQFTGLQDCEGTDVYEGDICLVHGLTYKIEYIQEFMTFCPFTKEQWQWYKDGSNHFKYCYEESHQGEDNTIYFLSQLDSYEIGVIGNIHTNPELLEQS